jgi:hypothetical protein
MTDAEQSIAAKKLLPTGAVKDMKKGKANRFGCPCFVMCTELNTRSSSFCLRNRFDLLEGFLCR